MATPALRLSILGENHARQVTQKRCSQMPFAARRENFPGKVKWLTGMAGRPTARTSLGSTQPLNCVPADTPCRFAAFMATRPCGSPPCHIIAQPPQRQAAFVHDRLTAEAEDRFCTYLRHAFTLYRLHANSPLLFTALLHRRYSAWADNRLCTFPLRRLATDVNVLALDISPGAFM
jgi:hypothetical protein